MYLTPKQARFVAEYPKDCNATRAAIRAGYSPKTANEQGSRLLAKVSIRDKIDANLSHLGEQAGLTAERLIQYLGWIINADITNLFYPNGKVKPFHSLPQHVAYAVASLNVKKNRIRIRLQDKLRVIELLAKRLGLFDHDQKNRHPDPTPKIDFSAIDTETIKRIAGMVRCPAKCCSLEISGKSPPYLTAH